jgi:hypothetical protein
MLNSCQDTFYNIIPTKVQTTPVSPVENSQLAPVKPNKTEQYFATLTIFTKRHIKYHLKQNKCLKTPLIASLFINSLSTLQTHGEKILSTECTKSKKNVKDVKKTTKPLHTAYAPPL